jgi:hypothetical protein
MRCNKNEEKKISVHFSILAGPFKQTGVEGGLSLGSKHAEGVLTGPMICSLVCLGLILGPSLINNMPNSMLIENEKPTLIRKYKITYFSNILYTFLKVILYLINILAMLANVKIK